MSISAVSKLDQSLGRIKQPHHNDSPQPPIAEIKSIYVCHWKCLCAQLVLSVSGCRERVVNCTVEGRAPRPSAGRGRPALHNSTKEARRPIDAGGLSGVGWKLRGTYGSHSRCRVPAV